MSEDLAPPHVLTGETPVRRDGHGSNSTASRLSMHFSTTLGECDHRENIQWNYIIEK